MGDQIRNIRRKKHLTRKHLAEHTGVSILRVMLWEINLLKPDADDARRIATALGVSLKELTGSRTDSKSAPQESSAMPSEFPFRDVLKDGEALLWYGQPNKNRIFTSADLVNIPVCLLLLALSVYWTYLSVLVNAWLLFISIPFVLVAVYLFGLRFLVKRYVKGRTHYALTDFRMLFIYDGKQQIEIRSVPYAEVKDVRMTLAGNTGSLYFDVYGSVLVSRAASQRLDNAGMTRGIADANAFFDIDTPKTPLEILQGRISQAKKQ